MLTEQAYKIKVLLVVALIVGAWVLSVALPIRAARRGSRHWLWFLLLPGGFVALIVIVLEQFSKHCCMM